ncbi:MAG: hypothetical protein U0840_03270 [Gemmataceae bacterium]
MVWRWWRSWLGRASRSPAEMQAQFLAQRAALEVEFFHLAVSSGKPRGLRWVGIDWSPEVAFAREKATGRLAALVGVTIHFEALAGSDMEELPAVGQPRHGSAVFFVLDDRWHTQGRAFFNLAPAEVLEQLAGQYDRA